MKFRFLLFAVLMGAGVVFAQKPVDSIRFFTDESMIELKLSTDLRKLQSASAEEGKDIFQDAVVNMKFSDSTVIEEPVTVSPRGHFRRQNCNLPPLLINFRNPGAVQLNKLGKLKLVIGCGNTAEDEQLILKEYLCYKIFNLHEDRSFRVRLVHCLFDDSRGKMKAYNQYAFFIEDDGDMARRNGYKKLDDATYSSEACDRPGMTMINLFEYMISNTDWSVPNNHNIQLMVQRKATNPVPFPVPYDFDHSGFVNAGYAVPSEVIGTESVRERVYRGFPRSKEELDIAIAVFNDRRKAVENLISAFPYLKEKNKKDVLSYLAEFYAIINNPAQVKKNFIDNARTN